MLSFFRHDAAEAELSREIWQSSRARRLGNLFWRSAQILIQPLERLTYQPRPRNVVTRVRAGLRIERNDRRQEFQGDLAIETRVLGDIDDAHAAGAGRPDDAVV